MKSLASLPVLSGTGSSPSSRSRKSGLILQRMTPQQKLNLKQQYIVWTEQAIKQMQTNAITNITQRIPIMLGVANEKTRKITTSRVNISEQEQNDIIHKVHSEIATWNGIQIGTCKTEKDQYSDYSNTARNWFNRNKAKIYGNHLFYTIIFGKIYQFLLTLSGITDTQQIVLFVDILDGILHSTVQFKRSKAHPVIPHQTFIQPNLFRSACSNLCQYYQVQWDLSVTRNKRQLLPNGQYAKNRERSRNINNAFVRKIEEIKQNVLYKNIKKALPLFHTNEFISGNGHVLSSQSLKPNQTSHDPKIEVHHVPSLGAECATNDGIKGCQTTNNYNNNYNNNMNISYNNNSYGNHYSHYNHNHNHNHNLSNAVTSSAFNTLRPTPTQSAASATTVSTTLGPIQVQYNDMLLQQACNNMNNPQIITAPIMPINNNTQTILALLNGVNCLNYNANHGQNNMVSQLRYSPLVTAPETPLNIKLHQNTNGTFSLSLDNIQHAQAIQLIADTLR